MQMALDVARAEAEAEVQKQATYDARARAVDAEGLARAQREAAILEASMPPAPGKVFSASGFTVAQMIEHWQLVGTDTIAKDTVETRLAILNHFAEHYGPNKPISGVRSTDVSAWTAHLAKHGMDGRRNDKNTRASKCSHLRMFFECAIDTGHYDAALGNPAARAEKFAKGEKGRITEQRGMEAFTLEQLQALFTPSNLARVEMPHSRRAMVLGLYFGARVSEIASLHLDQFKTQDGVHYVHIRGEKTQSSERLIPLHEDLIRLGVLDWVKQERHAKSDRLFPGVNIDRKSKGGAISSATTNYLKALDIGPDNRGRKQKRLGFHSFRSNVIQALQGGKEEFAERRHVYVGHTPDDGRMSSSAHRKHYMRQWTPDEVAILLARIDWGEWLDFDGLKTLLAEREPDLDAIAAKRNAQRAAHKAAGGAKGRAPKAAKASR
jgi:integrase